VPEPWQIGNVPGPRQANVITEPIVVSALIEKAGHPLLIIGHEAIGVKVGETKLTGLLAKKAEKGVQILATAHTAKELVAENFKVIPWMGVVEITHKLTDQAWLGLDGKGPYDLVIFLGVPYYLQSQMLSTLKHFAPHLKTISLDRYYQPNADWSFSNISEDDWHEAIKAIINGLLEVKSDGDV